MYSYIYVFLSIIYYNILVSVFKICWSFFCSARHKGGVPIYVPSPTLPLTQPLALHSPGDQEISIDTFQHRISRYEAVFSAIIWNKWPMIGQYTDIDYKWQASIHFNWPMIGQYAVIFYRYYKKLPRHSAFIDREKEN